MHLTLRLVPTARAPADAKEPSVFPNISLRQMSLGSLPVRRSGSPNLATHLLGGSVGKSDCLTADHATATGVQSVSAPQHLQQADERCVPRTLSCILYEGASYLTFLSVPVIIAFLGSLVPLFLCSSVPVRVHPCNVQKRSYAALPNCKMAGVPVELRGRQARQAATS